MICDSCHERAASVFVTKMSDNQTSKLRLCETCARARALDEGWLEGLEVDGETPLEELMLNLFTHLSQGGADELSRVFDDEKWSLEALAALDRAERDGEFSADEELADVVDEMEEDDFDASELADAEFHESPFGEDDLDQEALFRELDEAEAALFTAADMEAAGASDEELSAFAEANGLTQDEPRKSSGLPAVRCPKCETTWDRLREDGRVGCATCYETFAAQLNEVMGRLQQAAQHVGKTPRAATRRQRRLEHLRARRDHRLTMLRERLEVALKGEDYEEAAKLRDKIKIVESTIVDEP